MPGLATGPGQVPDGHAQGTGPADACCILLQQGQEDEDSPHRRRGSAKPCLSPPLSSPVSPHLCASRSSLGM